MKSLEDSCLLIEGLSQTIENKTKEQRGGFLLLLDIFGISLLGKMLAGKGVAATSQRE